MILLVDNYDSFSYNLYQLVGEIEPDIRVVRNDEMTPEEMGKLDPARIIREDQSRTTADNAVFTCKILREQYPGIKSLVLVSSDYHVPLGVLLFQEQAYLDEYETGVLPFSVISNAAHDTGGLLSPDSPMMQKTWLWSVANPQY